MSDQHGAEEEAEAEEREGAAQGRAGAADQGEGEGGETDGDAILFTPEDLQVRWLYGMGADPDGVSLDDLEIL